MLFSEAEKLLEKGHKICRESLWVMTKAGFAWGPWIALQRKFTEEDKIREEERQQKGDWFAPPILPSGPKKLAWFTLCEVTFFEVPEHFYKITDWIDVTERFEEGVPKGYTEYTYGRKRRVGASC